VSKSFLLIIDVQKGMDDPKWGPRNNPDAEEKIAALLAEWRKTRRPVFHVQHLSTEPDSPLRPERPGCEIKELVRPAGQEPVFQKRVNSAFIGTQLEDVLHRQGVETLVITGLTTQHCVSTTARMAGNLGFEVYLVGDAMAAFAAMGPDGKRYSAEEIHNVSLATLHGEFGIVVDAKAVISCLTAQDTHGEAS